MSIDMGGLMWHREAAAQEPQAVSFRVLAASVSAIRPVNVCTGFCNLVVSLLDTNLESPQYPYQGRGRR
jgi:hypothetical protein